MPAHKEELSSFDLAVIICKLLPASLTELYKAALFSDWVTLLTPNVTWKELIESSRMENVNQMKTKIFIPAVSCCHGSVFSLNHTQDDISLRS